MKKSDFYYDLPKELIAQHPIEPRNASRLMIFHKDSGDVEHKVFSDLSDYLKPGDCLILNNTRVLPARLFGTRVDTGAVVEFVLLKHQSADLWECIAGPGKKAKIGCEFSFSDKLKAVVKDVKDDGNRIVEFVYDGEFYSILDEVGNMVAEGNSPILDDRELFASLRFRDTIYRRSTYGSFIPDEKI